MASRALFHHRREAVLLQQLHRVLRGRHQAVVDAGREPQELQSFLGRGIVERRKILLFPCGAEGRIRGAGGWRGTSASAPTQQTGAIDADIAELLEIGDADVECLTAG